VSPFFYRFNIEICVNIYFRIALDRIGIGLTYTSKCGIPIITVLLTVLLDGIDALPNMATLFSLIPIAFGIAAASWSAPTYELFGFIMASISATAQSLLNVTSKRSLSKAGLSGPVGQRTMAAVGLLLTIIVNMIQMIVAGRLLQSSTKDKHTESINSVKQNNSNVRRDVPPIGLTVMAMIAYHIEYLLSFIFVTLVGPITYGICDAIRRLCIILFGRLFFGGDPLTTTNKIGIASALGGAVLYSIASSKNR
jgi:Triose-phosphate Transporter family